jgi:lipoprotein-releasing system permease protein
LIFFIQEDRKVRKFIVKGIYNTGLSEDFDNLYIFCPMSLIQKVNNWDSTQVAGFEIKTDNLIHLDTITKEIYDKVDYQTNVQNVKELYPQIFNWLELQNLNVIVIIVLISLIAGTTMISTLLILILENRRPIGLLKALGASDQTLSETFLKLSSKILIRGLLIGNMVGLGLAFLQLQTGFITLDETSYYIKSVPINFSYTGIILINLGTYVICMLMLLIPGKIISKINPIESLRFEGDSNSGGAFKVFGDSLSNFCLVTNRGAAYRRNKGKMDLVVKANTGDSLVDLWVSPAGRAYALNDNEIMVLE